MPVHIKKLSYVKLKFSDNCLFTFIFVVGGCVCDKDYFLGMENKTVIIYICIMYENALIMVNYK